MKTPCGSWELNEKDDWLKPGRMGSLVMINQKGDLDYSRPPLIRIR
jgi:hypothetical protein